MKTLKHYWQSWEKYPQLTWGFSIFWLLLINFIAFLWSLGSIGLIDETEPLFAEAARQMTLTGNWITPYFNEVTRFDKPPLVYWLMAIGYKLIGVNAWAVRLPSALAAIALTILCFFTLRYFGFATPATAKSQDRGKIQRQLWISAWIGSAIVALNLQTFLWSHQGVSDMLLSGCIGTSLFCFFWAYAEEVKSQKLKVKKILWQFPSKWYLAFYILSGLAVLTKGPIGIVIPGFVILAFLIYLGKLREVLSEMGIIWGSLIFLLITLPWYILVTLENGDAFINSFFGYHNFERFTSVVNHHSAPWYFYFLIVTGLFMPWSMYLPLGIARLRFWQRSFWQQQPRQSQLRLFAFFWFVCIFLFFTVATTKLPSYVLPLIPAATMLVTLVWSQEFTHEFSNTKAPAKSNKGLLISIISNLILLLLLTIASLQLPYLIGNDAAMINLSALIKQSNLPLKSALIWGFTGAISLLFLMRRQQWRWIICVNIIGFLAFMIFWIHPTFLLVDQVRQLPLRQMAEIVEQVRQPNERLVMIGFKKPSMNFYTQKPVGYFWTIDQPAADFLNNLPDHPATILLLAEPTQIAEAGLQPQEYQVLAQKSPYQLIRVEKNLALTKKR